VGLRGALLRTTHVPSDSVLRGRFDNQLLAKVAVPGVNVGLPGMKVRIESDDVVRLHDFPDGLINRLGINLPALAGHTLWPLPDTHQLGGVILNTDCNNRRRVVSLTAIEPEHNRLAR